MQKWSTLEIDVAKEIVNIALAKAADSLSFFTKEKVFIRGLDVEFNPIKDFDCKSKDQKINHVLTTEIKGDVSGKCFLVFDGSDVENFWKIALPENIQNDPDKKKEMGQAILMEADNIITASVVTQFANLLKINMHGYVPNYDLLVCEKMNAFFHKDIDNSEAYLQFSATFTSESIQINPEFIWMLDSVFMNKVQTFVEEEANLLKLKTMKTPRQ